jgi:hypothetical protein
MLHRSALHNVLAGCRPAASLLLVAVTWSSLAAAQGDDEKPDRLFEVESTLPVTMTAPWGDIENKADYQGAYPATIEYRDENGQSVQLAMAVERRGKKRQEACRFPPIRMRFEKDAVKGSAFRGNKSLKMVTHCAKSDRYDQYYVLEMLIYRMYNQLTEYSFRVRPLQVQYVDSEDGDVVDERFAFLIEDDSDVAQRNGLKKLDIGTLPIGQLDPQTGALMALFQYLIGNADWAALSGPDPSECCHNVKLVGTEPLQPGDLAVPVPYDFDSAGLVDADYAFPNPSLGINSVTQRLYRGYCAHNGALEAARQALFDHEAAFVALFENEQRLSSGSKKKAIRYLGKYFDTARDSGKFERYVIERCRK